MKEILIIDDDTDLSFIISEMLESYGYSVTTAVSGEEAFDLLSKHTYHLILLDINLPDTTGLELCRELRRVSQIPNVIKLRKRKKVTGTVKVSVTFIMSNFMNRM